MVTHCANDTDYGSKNEWDMIVYHPTIIMIGAQNTELIIMEPVTQDHIYLA
jgi:hypothetical protein